MINPIIPLENLVLFSGLAIALSAWLSWKSAGLAGYRLRLLLTTLRILGIAILLSVAFNPGHHQKTSTARQTTWAIMLDASESMLQKDASNKTRLAAARKLAEQALHASNDPSQIHSYVFSSRLTPVKDAFKNITAQKGNTDIAACGASLLAEFAGTSRLRGILLLSDGRQITATKPDTFTLHAQSQNTPVYAIPLGGKIEQKDIKIQSLRREYIAFKGQPVRIRLRVSASATGRIITPVTIKDDTSTSIAEKPVTLTPQKPDCITEFELKNIPPGRHIFSCSIPQQENEYKTWNNQDHIEIVVLEKPINTLHIEGLPYWDSKFLLQLLRRQPNLNVESIYRVGQDRFFKVSSNINKAHPVAGETFPSSIAAISRYDMIIIGKGCEYFLTPQNTRILRTFVRDLGGALIFSRGKPYHGSFPDLEPLEVGTWGPASAANVQLTPTITGEKMGLFGRLLPDRTSEIWSQMPPIHTPHTFSSLHSFTKVLATGKRPGATAASADIPLIASRRYGKGVILTINADGIWQWEFMSSTKNAYKLYNELWTQLLNWTITYGEFLPGETLSIHTSDPIINCGESTRIQIHHRPTQEHVEPPQVTVYKNDAPLETCQLTAMPDDALCWTGIFTPDKPGAYHIKIENGPESTITVLPPPDELSNTSANKNYLQSICRATGGKIITPKDIPAIVQKFETDNSIAENTETKWIPAWDNPFFLILLIIPFTLEWFLRRRNGLL